ncbi:MAG TPA: phosphate ABC transporter substrate-binding protein PstS, partial [Burkholderiaceae bacterium]|nr:phosphate ABC transporter substrate-binding protein PstS [Burkholderiaceae bacterium]
MKFTLIPSLARTALAAAVLASATGAALAQDVTGAGASFPAPVYAKWADAYNKATGARINYQSVGSGAGIRQIKAKTVDFGASDAPLKDDELAKDGLMQFPTVIGGVVPVVNVQGVAPGQLKLTGAVLGDIFLGKVAKWNDPAITALNPGVNLPDATIAVVRRADGSGTSFIFTNYLSKVNAEWKQKVGEGTAVNWPTGVGGKGNEGVASYVQRIDGAIGYVEYAYAKQNRMAVVLVKNREGEFVAPSAKTFQAAAAGAGWKAAPGMYVILTDAPGK